MNTYTPDLWVIVKLTFKDNFHYRVLASWCGGYLNGDSWKLSSGNESAKLEDNMYNVLQHSGSTYSCHTDSYGMSGYASRILDGFQEDADNSKDELAIQLLTEKEAKEYLNAL
jgi:hypothetical protein